MAYGTNTFHIFLQFRGSMKIINGLIILLLPFIFSAQKYPPMANVWSENWLSGSFNLNIDSNWKITLEEQFRLKFINDTYDRSFTELQIERKHVLYESLFTYGFAYRYIQLNDDSGNEQGLENHRRLTYYFAQKVKIERLSLKYRLQYQTRKELLARTNKHVSDFRKYWRIKGEMSYNFKNWKLDPKVSTELFLKNKNHAPNQHNKFRLSVATKYKLNKRNDISIKYLFERQFKSWNPAVIHAIALKYQFNHQLKN